MQLRTVEELLAGKDIDRPPSNVSIRKAPKAEMVAENLSLLGAFVDTESEDEGNVFLGKGAPASRPKVAAKPRAAAKRPAKRRPRAAAKKAARRS